MPPWGPNHSALVFSDQSASQGLVLKPQAVHKVLTSMLICNGFSLVFHPAQQKTKVPWPPPVWEVPVFCEAQGNLGRQAPRSLAEEI